MNSHLRPFLGPSLVVLLVSLGCSDDKPAASGGVFDSEQPSTNANFCSSYCDILVESAPGCEKYNENRRCEEICKFYLASECKTTYHAFADCLGQSGSASCFLPDAGRLTLMISACHDLYEEWLQCREEKNAEFCPY